MIGIEQDIESDDRGMFAAGNDAPFEPHTARASPHAATVSPGQRANWAHLGPGLMSRKTSFS